MELGKLRYFYTVAKYEHMTRAAEELHIAQPALTKAVKLLEEELGVPLFIKKGRNICLTVYGKHLKHRLDGIFPQLDRLPEELTALETRVKHTVRLNVLAASTIVIDAVIAYKKQHPHIIIELIQNEEEANCDISVVTNTYRGKSAAEALKQICMREKIFLAVPKHSPYAALSEISLSAVKNEEFISIAGSRPFRAICDRFCAVAGFKLRPFFESDSAVSVQNLIGAGAGIGFWPEYSWGKMSSSDMILLPISDPVCERDLIITLHSSAVMSDIAEDFYYHLIKYLEKKRKKAGRPASC